MKQIPLTKGYFAKVDDEDFDRLSKFKWQVTNNIPVYARKGQWINGKMVGKLMHREIMNLKDGEKIDHIDRDGLNNQKSNLRIATPTQNCHNRKARKHSNQYKGISLDKRRGRYQASITVNKKRMSLGYFSTPEEGAIAYDNAAIEHFGEFARTNKQMGVLSEV